MPGSMNDPLTSLPADFKEDKDAIIADLRRQLELSNISDVSSNVGSSASSGGRRRRQRRRKPQPKTVSPPVFIQTQKQGEKKETVKLMVGLNLNVELELKAQITGDLSVSLVVEKYVGQTPRKPGYAQKKFPKTPGTTREVLEGCYVHIGDFSFIQKWHNKEVSKRLTALVLCGVLGLGIFIGYIWGWRMAYTRYHAYLTAMEI